MKKLGRVLKGLVIMLALLCVAAIAPNLLITPAELAFVAATGWIFTTARWLQRVDGVAAAPLLWAGVFLALPILAHAFVRAIGKWPLRRTVCLLGIVWLSVFAAMAAVGVAHQIAWIGVSGHSFFKEDAPQRVLANANQVAHIARMREWSASKIRAEIAPELLERANIIIGEDGADRVTNIIVINRSAPKWFMEISPSATGRRRPIAELPSALGATER